MGGYFQEVYLAALFKKILFTTELWFVVKEYKTSHEITPPPLSEISLMSWVAIGEN